MNLIKERDARTKKRQKAKADIDSKVTLSSFLEGLDNFATLSVQKSEGKVRLLDEGSIVTAAGKVDIYIERGAIRKFVEGRNEYLTPAYLTGDAKIAKKYFSGDPNKPFNINSKYEGTINIGHQDFATFPCGIVGTWKQSDLTITDNGDDRNGLDVDLKLNEEHPLVQALKVQGIPVGVSVEMYLHWDRDADETLLEQVPAENKSWFMGAVDEIFIKDFAIVGECGNVGSSGSVDLQGVKMNEDVKNIEDIENDVLDEETEEMPDVEDTEVEDETSEETTEQEEDETSEENESVDEEDGDEVESEETEDEEDALAVAEETINTLNAEIESLKEQVEALKKSNNKKDKKIKEYAERNATFAKKFKGLNVSLGVTREVKKEVSHRLYATGDGIGE